MIDLKYYIVESLLDNKLLKPLRDFIQRNFKKRVGFKEMITICIQGDKYEFSATIDTGNGGVVPTLGVDKMNINNDKVTITIGDKDYTFDKKGEASPTVGNVVHHRPIIIIDYIKIGGRKLDEPFIAVTDERKKSTKTLINRDTMSKLNLVVDPSKNNLLSEKLHIDKDINVNKESSKYEEIWDVHEEDTVLSITISKNIRGLIYVKLDVVKISSINPDNTVIVKDISTNRDNDNFIYTFGDHTRYTQPIFNSFAFWREGHDWSALIKKDKAIQLINASLRSTHRKMFNGYHVDTKEKKEIFFNRLKKELEDND